MSGIPKRKDEDAGEEEQSPFSDCRKNVVLREAKMFHEPQLQPGKCQQVLTRLLYLVNQGETLSGEESIELFFAATKLFQAQDVHLRRLTYLLLKELRIDSDSSLIVVSCLNKDMSSKVDLFRANSIRVLEKIVDGPMVGQMDRFLKQSLVDKNPFIVSSVLVFGLSVYNSASDFIKRWVNEVGESLTSRSPMVQFHALALLHRIRQSDKLAVHKIVTTLARQSSTSHLASIAHLRILATLMHTNNANAPLAPDLLKQVTDLLHSRNPMVSLEAARVLSRLTNMNATTLAPAVSVLQEFISSAIPAQRFAAVRTLSEIVSRFPLIVQPAVQDLEHLISDSNRSIATLAITTLLKTGVEANVDRLMKSIQGFMQEIQDDFKIVLVDAIRALCLKFPTKHGLLLSFLAGALREEGGFKYKKALVDAMLSIISSVPESAELGLEYFCEFIEDCEFAELAVTILHLLGERGPATSNPAKYIRFIFNRVILETASVRAAAVSALASFGAQVPALRDNVCVLLRRCLNDNDDEMRDRAIFYLAMLNPDAPSTSTQSQSQSSTSPSTLTAPLSNDLVSFATLKPLPSLVNLEYSLELYLENAASQSSSSASASAFTLEKHIQTAPVDDDAQDSNQDEKQTINLGAPTQNTANSLQSSSGSSASSLSSSSSSSSASSSFGYLSSSSSPYWSALSAISEFRPFGPLFKSSEPVPLTESETEYVVTCVKHIFASHVVFQFNVTLNMEDQQLSNVSVEMEVTSDETSAGVWTEELAVVEPKLVYQVAGTTYVAFLRPQLSYSCTLSCTLHFTVHDVDSSDNQRTVDSKGHADEYQLEEIEVIESDFMRPDSDITAIPEFKRQWEALGESCESMKKFSLGLENTQVAVTAVLDLLGMGACEGAHIVPEGAKTHAVFATGTFLGTTTSTTLVLARAAFIQDAKQGVTLKIAIRSNNSQINNMLLNAIR